MVKIEFTVCTFFQLLGHLQGAFYIIISFITVILQIVDCLFTKKNLDLSIVSRDLFAVSRKHKNNHPAICEVRCGRFSTAADANHHISWFYVCDAIVAERGCGRENIGYQGKHKVSPLVNSKVTILIKIKL